jgi:hypothetical protein
MILLLLQLLSSPGLAADYSSPEQVLAHFESEPTVRAVQQMVLDYSKTDPRFVDAWLSASHAAAWLPEFQAKFGYSTGTDQGYDYITDPVNPTGVIRQQSDDGANVDYDVDLSAKWRLDELIMSSNRIRVISETQDIVKLRDKVLDEVTRVYFDRRRLQVEMLLNPGDLKTQLKNELRLQELTAQLDAYTGGRFSSALKAK